ncbi:hypothetical protein CBR_g45781 [Chara braunii]|uniref:Reverse transcriptase domain-containing protein n=1 Tax=Chara braunii TaxID=69332 RepID=A0A388LZJ3_CHABU|nr:hypothetical protein CBR_g45781 [Chara braunii]|eukprot:GBG87629.1 hypothetical protein CBR_g45781 [Chara braunii]
MNVTFQNFVNKTRLMQGMINFCVIVYMDDILVYSETYHGHAQHIEWTLGTLRNAGEHRAGRESIELLIIQARRTEVEGDLLGFVFGSVQSSHRQLIVWELTVPFVQLVDYLPLDIISKCDESPVSHVLQRRLTPSLHWSTCLEGPGQDGSLPSRSEYLNPRGVSDTLFFQPQTAEEAEMVAEESEVEDESEEETPKEAGSYSEYSEEESGEDEEEEEEDQPEEEEEESEWKTFGTKADRAETREEDPEAARKREEIAVGKQPLEFASGADRPIPDDPTKDPELPKNDDGDPPDETSSALARTRWSRS